MGILDQRSQLAGKTAVVIGGAEGLGAGICLALAQSGVQVALCDSNAEALAKTVEQLSAYQAQTLALEADVCDEQSMQRFWQAFDLKHPKIDILVNVVGGVRHGAFLDSDAAQWQHLTQLNFGYVVASCHAAASRARACGNSASIINITTIEGYRAAPGFSVYAGLKAGVANLSRTLAIELAPYGIRLNCVAPDQTPTPGLRRCINTETYDPAPKDLPQEHIMQLVDAQARNAIPLGRTGRVEDIENAVLFLASELSCYLTGQTLHIDGGAMASAGWFNFPGLGMRNRVPLQIINSSAYQDCK